MPTTGLPSEQFCAAGETYLAKFPGLPQVKPPIGATPVSAITMCAFTARVGDMSAPVAALGAVDLTREVKEGAMFKQLCSDDSSLKPGFSSIDLQWAKSRGWSVWGATSSSGHQAMFCTDDHYFSASISNVAGATQQDAVDTILAAIE